MKLNLSDIARVPGSSARYIFDEKLVEVEDMPLLSPVTGHMDVSCTDDVLMLQGVVIADLEVLCSRCGIPISLPIRGEFFEDFIIHLPKSHLASPLADESEIAPDARIFFEGSLDLNLEELLRQVILVNLPLKWLCRDDCQGVCLQCGHRFNEGPCACLPAAGTGKLAELQRLLDERRNAE